MDAHRDLDTSAAATIGDTICDYGADGAERVTWGATLFSHGLVQMSTFGLRCSRCVARVVESGCWLVLLRSMSPSV